jgi:protoporphyrinogen oxidase
MGEEFRRVSAVFIWTYVKRMFSARDASASNEQLGHVSGGYRRVFDRLTQRIEGRGGAVRVQMPVRSIQAHRSGGLTVVTPDGSRRYDHVVFTAPTDALERIVDPRLADVRTGGSSVEYLGVVCAVVVSRAPLTRFYVLNLAEPRVPFTGVIGMSNVVDPSETAGYHLTYLPRYVPSRDPLFEVKDDEIRSSFLEGARIVLPDLDSAGIVDVHVNRARRVQPLQVMGFSGMVPATRTHHDRLFVLNTAQFVSNTLNNNEVVRAVDEFMTRHGPGILGGGSTGRAPTEVEGA